MYTKNLFYITINMFMNLLFIQILKFLLFLTTSQSVVKVTKKDIAHSTPCLFFYINSIKDVLLPSEVGRHLAPLLGFPLYDRDGDAVALEPCLGTFDELEELFGLFIALELGLAAFLAYPTDGCAAIAIDGHLEPLLVEHGQSVYDGKKLSDVVGAVHGAKVEYLLSIT